MKLRQFFTLLITTLLAILVIVIIWTQIVPEYQAKAEIFVSPVILRLVFDTEDTGLIPLYSSFINVQISIITSQAVLKMVLDQREVQNTNWYKNLS